MFKVVARRIAAGALVASLSATTAFAETLTDTLVAAYNNSQLLEQNRALLRVADEDVAIATSALRPIIDYTLRQTFSEQNNFDADQTSFGITASMLLFNFGRSQLAIESANEQVFATREALRDVEQDVLLNAVTAYLSVRRALESIALGQNNVRVISEQLRAAEDRFEVGEVTRTDVAQAESRLAQARSSLADAQGGLQVARELFRAAVGRYPGNLAPPPRSPSLPSSLNEAMSIGETRNPTILEAQHLVRAADLAAQSTQQEILPEITGSASVQRTLRESGSDTTDNSLTLSLSGPIYQGGLISAQFRQAVAQAASARAGLNQNVILVRQEVGTAWSDLQVARAVITASIRGVESAEIAFEGVQEEARLGARTTLDVLDSEQDLLDARTALVNAEIDAIQSVYDLLAAMGLMTVSHLNLPVVTYDPTAYYNAVRNAPATSTRGDRLDRVLQSISRQ